MEGLTPARGLGGGGSDPRQGFGGEGPGVWGVEGLTPARGLGG